nr:ribonuclease H-like domain-containing protein [Tanacetum cinerariifolium]
MRIEQYFLMTDYSLWEVFLNGDSPVPTRIVEGVVQPVAPTTAEQKLVRMNELKACGTLLMALPDKHQALKDKGVINSGCSRHMIGNMSYLSDFKELNGGYVAFGGNPKGGKITGKGKIKT